MYNDRNGFEILNVVSQQSYLDLLLVVITQMNWLAHSCTFVNLSIWNQINPFEQKSKEARDRDHFREHQYTNWSTFERTCNAQDLYSFHEMSINVFSAKMTSHILIFCTVVVVVCLFRVEYDGLSCLNVTLFTKWCDLQIPQMNWIHRKTFVLLSLFFLFSSYSSFLWLFFLYLFLFISLSLPLPLSHSISASVSLLFYFFSPFIFLYSSNSLSLHLMCHTPPIWCVWIVIASNHIDFWTS